MYSRSGIRRVHVTQPKRSQIHVLVSLQIAESTSFICSLECEFRHDFPRRSGWPQNRQRQIGGKIQPVQTARSIRLLIVAREDIINIDASNRGCNACVIVGCGYKPAMGHPSILLKFQARICGPGRPSLEQFPE